MGLVVFNVSVLISDFLISYVIDTYAEIFKRIKMIYYRVFLNRSLFNALSISVIGIVHFTFKTFDDVLTFRINK